MNSSSDLELDRLAERIGRAMRAHRTARAMSLGQLARDCGLSRTILARIESGAGNPSVETLWRVSRALDVPLGALLAEDRAPRVRAIRAREGEHLGAGTDMEMWLLHAEGRPHRAEMYELALRAGADERREAHLPGTHELLICVQGRARIGPLREEVELGPGDAVWFVADREHRYAALADTRLLGWMLYGVDGGA